MIHFENRDCMDALKEFPDGFFDLAIVDPPYGDGNRTNTVASGGGYWQRFGGRFDKYKALATKERAKTGRIMGLSELEELGRRSMQKNCFVGRCAGAGVFRGAVPRLTESDNMGG